MQTFLPYPDFADTAAVLDPKRLGKQRVEALQVLRALIRPVYGWKHHPAVLMWDGYEEALGAYAVQICREWCRRGHSDTCERKILDDLATTSAPVPPRPQLELAGAAALPPWIGDDAVHRSHRSALLRKDPAWYGRVFDDVPDDLPYVWPGRPSRP